MDILLLREKFNLLEISLHPPFEVSKIYNLDNCDSIKVHTLEELENELH